MKIKQNDALRSFSTEELLLEMTARCDLQPAPSTIRLIDPTYKICTLGIGADNVAQMFLAEDDLLALQEITANKVAEIRPGAAVTEDAVHPDRVLTGAIGKLGEVLVIGERNGGLYLGLSNSSVADNVLLCERAKTAMLNSILTDDEA